MKRILISILLVNVLGSCFTQSIYFSGGMSISKLDWEEYDLIFAPHIKYDDNLFGYSSGVGIKYLNKNYFNLNTYIGIVKKGGKQFIEYETFPGPLINETRYASLHYLNFTNSIELKYKFCNLIQPFFRVGARIDYLVNSSYQFEEIKERDELSSFNYGINFGLGCIVDFEKMFLGVFWNKNYNFNKIAEYPAELGMMGGSLNDQTMILSVEFGYNIK